MIIRGQRGGERNERSASLKMLYECFFAHDLTRGIFLTRARARDNPGLHVSTDINESVSLNVG